MTLEICIRDETGLSKEVLDEFEGYVVQTLQKKKGDISFSRDKIIWPSADNDLKDFDSMSEDLKFIHDNYGRISKKDMEKGFEVFRNWSVYPGINNENFVETLAEACKKSYSKPNLRSDWILGYYQALVDNFNDFDMNINIFEGQGHITSAINKDNTIDWHCVARGFIAYGAVVSNEVWLFPQIVPKELQLKYLQSIFLHETLGHRTLNLKDIMTYNSIEEMCPMTNPKSHVDMAEYLKRFNPSKWNLDMMRENYLNVDNTSLSEVTQMKGDLVHQ